MILQLAGLLRVARGLFRITRRGKQLAEDENVGGLYALLFRTHFQKFNLALLDYAEDNEALQSTISFSMFALSHRAESWQSVSALSGAILALPARVDVRSLGVKGGTWTIRSMREFYGRWSDSACWSSAGARNTQKSQLTNSVRRSFGIGSSRFDSKKLSGLRGV